MEIEGQVEGEFTGQRLPMTAKDEVADLVHQKSSPTKRKPTTLATLHSYEEKFRVAAGCERIDGIRCRRAQANGRRSFLKIFLRPR